MSKPGKDKLDRQIIQTVETAKLESVQQLIDKVQALSSKSRQEIMDRILYLQQEGRIHLKPPRTTKMEKHTSYLGSKQAFWYWGTMTLTIATAIVVSTVPEDSFPLVYLRYALGAIFILWLPGYTFVKALFPQTLPFLRGLAQSRKTTEKNLATIERFALSFGMSIALIPIVALLLNYTLWGIRLTPIVLSLTTLTIIFATVAVIREYQDWIKSKR